MRRFLGVFTAFVLFLALTPVAGAHHRPGHPIPPGQQKTTTTESTTTTTSIPTTTTTVAATTTTTVAATTTTVAPTTTTIAPTTTTTVGGSCDTTVQPGSSIQSAVDSQPAGATICIGSGVHHDEQLKPKTGQKIVGEPGAVLDGEGTAEFAFNGGGEGVVIEGLIIRGYNPPLQACAVHGGANWIVRGNEFTANLCALAASHGWQVLGNNIHHQGQLGLKGVGVGVVIDGNIIADNNTDGYDSHWEAGGTKFVHSTNLTLANNIVYGNEGPGLWTDGTVVGVLVAGNHVFDNFGPGINIEISEQVVVRDNLVENNGHGWTRWTDGAGILVNTSSDVEVYSNTVRGNRHGIAGQSRVRGGGYELRNLYVHDNIVESGGRTGVVSQDDVLERFEWNLVFENNDYGWCKDEARFDWAVGVHAGDQWQGFGQDLTGSWAC